MRHALPLLGALLWCGLAQAQAVHKRNLLTSLGGGAGIIVFDASADSLDLEVQGGGALRFAFGYAVGDRWSVGFHYDRLGSDDLGPDLHRIRFTTYTVEVAFRPVIGTRGALELQGALGPGLMALTPQNERLPVRMASGAATFGLRYLHIVLGSVGAFVGLEHSTAGTGQLTFNDQVLENDQATPLTASWNAQRFTAGLFVRF